MYGLIGYPLGHSFSKSYFTDKFKFIGVKDTYELFPIPSLDILPELIRDKNMKGFNVTIPYKQDVLKYLSCLSQHAKNIGAVNVVKVNRNNDKNILEGFNTDWLGFRDSLTPLLTPDINGALILGTGGASKAVIYAIKQLNIKFKTVSRDKRKGDLTYEEISQEIIDRYKLIVNTTPLGTYPNVESCPNLPYQYITEAHLCYDLVYNPQITEFMKRCANHGATVKNGLEMLHLQADYAWKIWSD